MLDAIDGLFRFSLIVSSITLALLAMLRMFGTRPVSELSSAELIIAVALGLAIGLILLSPSTSGAEEAVSIFGLTLILCGSRLIHRWRTKPPAGPASALVFHRESFLPEAQARTTERAIIDAVRAHGYRTLGEISAIILEAEGTFTITPYPEPRPVLRVVSSNTSFDD